MYVKDPVFRTIKLKARTPIPEGAALTANGEIALPDGSDVFGLLTERIDAMPPTGLAYVLVGGVIDTESEVNKGIDIPYEIKVALSDIRFVPWGSGGGGGGDDYNDLRNKPAINGVTLMGNKSIDDLGVDTMTNSDILEVFNRVFN